MEGNDGRCKPEPNLDASERTIDVNGRRYRLPTQSTVVVCVDGCEFDYLEAAVAAGVAPFIGTMLKERRRVQGRLRDPVVHQPEQPLDRLRRAAVGAWHLRQLLLGPGREWRRGAEVMMNDPRLSARRHLAGGRREAGAAVAVVTAKDKLRRLLGWQLKGICFSAEKADKVTLEENGIDDVLDLVGLPVPDVYSAALSEFVFAAGVRLAQTRKLDLMYLSTTDYIQHKWAPGHRRRERVLRDDGRLSREARRARLGDRPDRRSRHERQARPAHRRAERDLSAGRAR